MSQALLPATPTRSPACPATERDRATWACSSPCPAGPRALLAGPSGTERVLKGDTPKQRSFAFILPYFEVLLGGEISPPSKREKGLETASPANT